MMEKYTLKSDKKRQYHRKSTMSKAEKKEEGASEFKNQCICLMSLLYFDTPSSGMGCTQKSPAKTASLCSADQSQPGF